MPLDLKHIWVAFIVVVFVNAYLWRKKGAMHSADDPELRRKYDSVTRGLVLWGNIPWIVMGTGILAGGVPSVFSYFDPLAIGLWAHAFFASIAVVYAAGARWIFHGGGDEVLASTPGLVHPHPDTSRKVRIIYIATFMLGVVAVSAMYSGFASGAVAGG